ncbi:multidrug efflux SMR transporter [Ectobacillus sp. JY-23]|uniref:DMT family transporter n=1 Tax=Ectobacillus sp. JY-23 TaxID=2933872 RepID=UPI001FF6EAA0|nr:multidrug efflux SMR transporter [Ectobacillus sp. JY-23]UOY93977.1 multidrug efflux SMR transporter [Ectobacillus sp. JY-23]
MAWFMLILAGLCEVVGVILMKVASEQKSWLPKLGLVLSFSMSFLLLSKAMHHISVGSAYAVWTGIGTGGSALIGILLFKESREWKRLFYIGCILFGAVGLKITH